MRVKVGLIIQAFKENASISETAKLLGIHRATVYRWLKRAKSIYSRLKLSTRVKRKSTRPKTIHWALSSKDKFGILQLRRQRGCTAVKIKYQLKLSASINMVHRFLKQEGLINKYGNHRRPRYQETTHMHLKNVTTIGYLQMEVKYITPELSGLPWTCFEYAVVDIYSRYKEAVILNQLDDHGATLALITILKELPFKSVFIQTDNGLEFQGIFHQTVLQLGLKHHFIHKRTPNENAVIERTFRTDEEEFFFYMKKVPEHYDELREMFAGYLRWYNYQRPHLGINLKTPYEIIVANVVRE